MRLSTVVRSLKNVRLILLLGAKQQKNIAFHVQFHGGLPTCCSKTNSNFFERATYRLAAAIGPMFNFYPKYFMGFFFALCSNNVKPSYTWCQSVQFALMIFFFIRVMSKNFLREISLGRQMSRKTQASIRFAIQLDTVVCKTV